MNERVTTGDGRPFYFREPYLAGIYYGEPSPKVHLLFTYYLEPHPEGFSGYFTPSDVGWVEERIDPCGVHVFDLRRGDGAHLFLVQWHIKDEEPHEVTHRLMRQMGDTWAHMFPNQSISRAEVLAAITQGTIVSPAEMGLGAENAGAERTAGPPPAKKRRWPFG